MDALKFKDDIFLGDRITTGQQSLVRLCHRETPRHPTCGRTRTHAILAGEDGGGDKGVRIKPRRRGMCTCGHSEKDHAPCGKCLVEGCACEVFERQLDGRRRS